MKLKPILAIALLVALPASFTWAQTSPAAKTSPAAATKASPTAAAKTSPTTTTTTSTSTAAARTDVYHVHFTHAAPGKANALADALKQPDPTSPMPGHAILLRHQDGDSWDYVAIEHMGTKANVDATRAAQPTAARDASDWHTDTYVSGPSWADFSKAMGINEGAGKSAVYIVSVYRAIPGHREQLDALLGAQSAGDPAAGNVVMQHLEGAAWTFVAVARYATWEDFVKSETNAAADQAKGAGDWAKLRDHSSYHTDTLADRIMP
ncbi:MAG: hypothetical protein V7609_2929 [Verrucomicrobiota bacterium]